MTEMIVFVIFIVVFTLLIIENVRLRLKNLDIKRKTISLAVESAIIAKRLEKELELKQNALPENNEGFLKFISQSRDWAFDYIENVQGVIKQFVDDIEPEIAYFDEYGVVTSAHPHYYSMKKISGAYKELKKALPEDYDKIDR